MRIAGRKLGLVGLASLAAGLLAAACQAPPADTEDPFTATGQLIALSGGEAGPRNACFTCHGLRGEGDALGTPRLAGLSSGYLVKQLQDYADGRRPDPTMHAVARRLSPEQRQSVAAWYAALPMPPPDETRATASPAVVRLYHQGDPARGLTACASCHGAAGEGRGPANPPLAGQPPAYLAEQLRLWREGKRKNSPRHVMLTIGQALSEAEIVALADYAADLPGAEPAPSAR